MSTLAHALGATATVTLRGQSFTLSPLTLGDVAAAQVAMQANFAGELGDLKTLTADLPESVRNDALRECLKSRRVSLEQAASWMDSSLDGMAFFLAHKVNQHQPGRLSPVDAAALIAASTPDEIRSFWRAVNAASGRDEAANFSNASAASAGAAGANAAS